MEISKMYLTLNTYSRPGIKIKKVSGIVIHWVGNAASTAQANRNYFEGLKSGQKMNNGVYRYASSHYIVGLQGEIIACVPENEIAYHASQMNQDHIGIEVCHQDWTGKFNLVTYKALIELIIDICSRYKLNPLTDVIRHYDVNGKECPRYYVRNVQAWNTLKKEVASGLKERQIIQIKIELNGVEKKVDAFNVEGVNFIKLRDLADDKILVGYNEKKKQPIIKVK